MSGTIQGPAYLSTHAAEVTLSEIRPIKLNSDALVCINVLLDEFLYDVLRTAQSITTEKLRTGLLGVLPTTLGKEALLEAEVELRSYRERNTGRQLADDDRDTFDLNYAFELLKLKCTAYSTLNETDEDPMAERRLEERMGGRSPATALVAQASLYLTAILEAICEHILSNVGRVASRDSSKSLATVPDLFTALCEDDAIYGLFKTMNVYSEIEEMSKAPKVRRSKSLNRADSKMSKATSRASSPYQESSSQLSSDAHGSPSGSRTSLDKRSMKKLAPRASSDTVHTTTGRSDSALSEETQQTWSAYQEFEDDASLAEFDDLMRSTSTMKVSLTPDRLRTMEIHKQEKGRDRRAPLSQPEPELPPPSRGERRPTLRHVDSIIEDDESSPPREVPTTPVRSRSSSLTARSRSSSNAPRLLRKPSKTGPSQPKPPTPPVPMYAAQPKRVPPPIGAPQSFDPSPFPTKTRRKQVNRESLDLDAVMNGSDDEDMADEMPQIQSPPRTPASTRRTPKVSATTRELMSFLDDGPPGSTPRPPVTLAPATTPAPKLSKAGRELLDFLNEGPPEMMQPPPGPSITFAENEKPRGGGRLQRMMSKLSLNGDKAHHSLNHQSSDEFRRPSVVPTPSILRSKSSNGSLGMASFRSSPRPPPLSPPASPQDHLDYLPRYRTPSTAGSTASRTPKWEQLSGGAMPAPPTPASQSKAAAMMGNGYVNGSINGQPPTTPRRTTVNGATHVEKTPVRPDPINSVVYTPQRTAVPVVEPPAPVVEPPQPIASPAPEPVVELEPKVVFVPAAAQTEPEPEPPVKFEDKAQDLRALMAKATTAEECRLILEMFLVKAGVAPVEDAEAKSVDANVYPSPSPSELAHETTPTDTMLEQMMVEFFLGSEAAAPEGPPLRKKKHSSRRLKVLPDYTSAPPSPTPSARTEDYQRHPVIVEAL
ncbi:hypothetical protein CYLTODRAFT_365006 [Cylindrobasidium torrendii FP15055 ss-10]|uniref:Uncharacterized protein n=1 Tax=Cylindrobasidium torrendii FP15055 ss-10 TaxID=1314674 RepID=A0A0D7BUW1_9AGAR|nr:hypothetical protein CYLTODRAFT_365006 [Cylindrobasidium torrendii FP15055 ss-10]